MVDTSKEAVEKFIQGPIKDAVLSEGLPTTSEDTSDVYRTVELLRALSAERDAARDAALMEAAAMCSKSAADDKKWGSPIQAVGSSRCANAILALRTTTETDQKETT